MAILRITRTELRRTEDTIGLGVAVRGLASAGKRICKWQIGAYFSWDYEKSRRPTLDIDFEKSHYAQGKICDKGVPNDSPINFATWMRRARWLRERNAVKNLVQASLDHNRSREMLLWSRSSSRIVILPVFEPGLPSEPT